MIALNPRSKYVKAPDNFRGTLKAWDLTIRRAPLQSSMRDTRPQEGSAAADAYAQGTFWGIGGWCSPETQSVTPGSYWWSQLEGSMADRPQSWHSGTGAQPVISCFELLAQLALLVCRLRSPLPTSGRITLRQSSDNVTAGAAIVKGFTTAHPLRRFVQVITRWATISRIKLEVDYLPGIDNEWADALSRNKEFIKGFFPSERRIDFSVNDLLSPGHEPMRVPEHDRWPGQLRKLESMNAQTLVPHGFCRFLPRFAKSRGVWNGRHSQTVSQRPNETERLVPIGAPNILCRSTYRLNEVLQANSPCLASTRD